MTDQFIGSLLPLFVAVPMLFAGVSVILRRRMLDRILIIAIPVLVLAAAVALMVHHEDVPVLASAIGSFEGGIAIPFVSDTLTAVMLATTGLATAASCWFLTASGEDRLRFVPALALLLMSGVNGALLTGDLFNLFVFVEVMLLPSYALIAVTGTWRRLGISRMFVIVNLVTSAILVMGVGLVYGSAGTVNLAALAGRAGQDPQVALAVTVVLLALSIKAGVVPVHGWMPRAYPGTSAGVMALFSALHTKVALYAIFRIYFTAFAPGGSAGTAGSSVTTPAPHGTATTVAVVIAVVVLATMVLGALGSLGESRFRGVMAFQMIAGVGHILIGVAIASPAAVAAGLFYLIHHVVTMASLLTTAGAVEETYGTGILGRLSGLLHRDRLAAVVVALGLLSLAGLPPTSGLWAKLGLARAAVGSDGASGSIGHPAWYAPVFLTAIVLASVATLMALQRLWGQSFAGEPLRLYRPVLADGSRDRGPEEAVPDSVRIPGRLLAPGVAMIGVSVLLFVFAGTLMPFIETAAAGLFETGPYVEAVLGEGIE